jgi:predicted Zn finger-like uncharacterized protein
LSTYLRENGVPFLGGEPTAVKFLCDNCKAKYQIADEKVAGKTVRMKCRKCGHQIEVRAEVTETSVASVPPHAPTASGAPRPPQKSLATSLSAAKPRATSPSLSPSGALAGAFKSNVHDAPASAPDTSAASIELSVTDEWYVAINGVPVGPVRISELRRKAATGAVTEESLCWQEGLEEWRPIRSIPELAALVREAAQGGNRPSHMGSAPEISVAPPAPAPAPRAPSVPSAPRHPVAPATGSRATAPPPAPRPTAPPAPTGRSNVVPLRPAASSVDEVPLSPLTPMGGSATALAPSFAEAPSLTPAPSLAPAPSLSAPSPAVPMAPVGDPFALSAAPPVAPPREPAPSTVPHVPPPHDAHKKGVPLWFWPILVLALGFGGGVAFLAFRPQPAPAPVVIQVPAPPTPATTPADKGDVPPPPASAEPAAATSTTESKGKPTTVAAKSTGPAKTADVPEKKGLDLGSLVPGGGGPNVGPNTSPGGGAGGGLDQAAVERIVAVHRNGVKRTCWERGGADQKSSVNVTITANVAPNGSVASTSSSGDDPVVAKCIESQVKTWQFPAPGSSTTINIPFKFVRQ